jgi:hypothetical protein
MTWLIPEHAVFYGGEFCVAGEKVKIADQDSAEMAKYGKVITEKAETPPVVEHRRGRKPKA